MKINSLNLDIGTIEADKSRIFYFSSTQSPSEYTLRTSVLQTSTIRLREMMSVGSRRGHLEDFVEWAIMKDLYMDGIGLGEYRTEYCGASEIVLRGIILDLGPRR
uniref:Uncharacterized protein n=1 Tax=Solanum lycopersicum TaxID=4081 RepID=A0A3Q7JCX7_SOLLC